MNQNTLPDVSMDEIIEIVRGTKKILLDAEARSHIHQKGPADFVTEVDFHVQEHLSKELTRRYPEIQFMGRRRITGTWIRTEPCGSWIRWTGLPT